MNKNHKLNCKCTKCQITDKCKTGTAALHYKHGRTHNNKCIDCEKHISFSSKRCKSCGQKYRHKDNKKIINHCINCGKEIDNYSKRCQKCYWNYLLSERMLGEKNRNWIIDRNLLEYPIEFNNQLKEQIRNRDNYECQNCGITEEEHLTITGVILTIHHIDYDKKNCNKDNLVTVCRQCNVKANYNRNCWQRYYGQIIKKEE